MSFLHTMFEVGRLVLYSAYFLFKRCDDLIGLVSVHPPLSRQ